jgi:hypothetical protein
MDLRQIGWDGMDWINLAQDGDIASTSVTTSHIGEKTESISKYL